MSIKVRVVEQSGVFKDNLEIAEGSTVKSALLAAGARLDVNKEIRVNNETAALEDIVENNDTIFVIPQTDGNV